MSKNKSLGSSPIGYKSESNSMGFIPDLGVSKAKDKSTQSSPSHLKAVKKDPQKEKNSSTGKEKPSKKKIVSYNLEVDLVEEIKTIADKKEMYYSSLVSVALKTWIAENS